MADESHVLGVDDVQVEKIFLFKQDHLRLLIRSPNN